MDKISSQTIIDVIQAGDRVTILTPNGIGRNGVEYRECTGTAVMRNGTYAWVLNMGGKHGVPAVATNDNIVRVKKGKRK